MKYSFRLILARVLTGRPLVAAEPAKPKCVFIFADGWGWGVLSCRGHPWLKTLKGQDNLECQFKDFDSNSDGQLNREVFIGPSAK